jgi:hypothetical protein
MVPVRTGRWLSQFGCCNNLWKKKITRNTKDVLVLKCRTEVARDKGDEKKIVQQPK